MMANGSEQKNMVEIARKLAELGQAEKALEAYTIALKQDNITAEERMEAACAVLQYGEDYKPAYNAFLALFQKGKFREDIFSILNEAFYAPNVKQQAKQYKKNCKLLKAYPYLFRKDFIPFEELPIKFFPYDDNGVLPFDTVEERFDDYIDFNEPVIRHYFFRDLSQPIFAENIFSQYELEYLKDNVRRSDWVGYENHIYLYYSNWAEFCSYLQCLDMNPILEDEKIVFLIGDEKSQYPIDFKERFGIDYSTYPVKPVGIREINKLVFHTQFHAHCGGDFFNEILHEHPNMFSGESVIYSNFLDLVKTLQEVGQTIIDSKGELTWNADAIERYGIERLRELESLKKITLKDAFIMIYLGGKMFSEHLNPAERIVPAMVLQPHFHNLNFKWEHHDSGAIALSTTAFDELKETGLIEQFKYIKTFSPIRRMTTSHGATLKFMQVQVDQGYNFGKPKEDSFTIITDVFLDRIQNRSFMVSKKDRMFADSRIVRFEDAKLNTKATFTALAEFMDVPYNQSMTYCSDFWGRDPGGIGFNTASVYRTYEEFCDIYERKMIEYMLRDVYEIYGYDYEQYDGKLMTSEEEEELMLKCQRNLDAMKDSWHRNREKLEKRFDVHGEELDLRVRATVVEELARSREMRLLTLRVARYGLSFCDANGDKLTLIEPLKLDPALLEQPLYR